MTNWLIHTFIKDYENIQDEQVRYSYGILTTIMGLVCNTFLCLLKVISGMMIHSVSIMSDGFNNLSDGLVMAEWNTLFHSSPVLSSLWSSMAY